MRNYLPAHSGQSVGFAELPDEDHSGSESPTGAMAHPLARGRLPSHQHSGMPYLLFALHWYDELPCSTPG